MQLTDYSKPTPLVAQALADFPPGEALDIGAYEGRNSLYLAKLGWKVTAVDTDETALKALRDAADKQGLSIATITADVREYEPTGRFDAVLCLMVLHFLPEKDIASAIANMQAWTKPSGLNLITAFTDSNPPGTRPYLFPSHALEQHYGTWKIHQYEEAWSSWVVPQGKTEPERYMTARLVAERP